MIQVEEKKTGRTLGLKLAHLSKLQGETQQSLATKCGIARISVNRFFNGHTEIRAEDLADMLAVLGIDIDKQIDAKIAEQFTAIAGT